MQRIVFDCNFIENIVRIIITKAAIFNFYIVITSESLFTKGWMLFDWEFSGLLGIVNICINHTNTAKEYDTITKILDAF